MDRQTGKKRRENRTGIWPYIMHSEWKFRESTAAGVDVTKVVLVGRVSLNLTRARARGQGKRGFVAGGWALW